VGPVTEARQEVPPSVHCAEPSARLSSPRSHFTVLQVPHMGWQRGHFHADARGQAVEGIVQHAGGGRAAKQLAAGGRWQAAGSTASAL